MQTSADGSACGRWCLAGILVFSRGWGRVGGGGGTCKGPPYGGFACGAAKPPPLDLPAHNNWWPFGTTDLGGECFWCLGNFLSGNGSQGQPPPPPALTSTAWSAQAVTK